ncbi:hypothetical protein MFU01_47660 [Myxococcus fulvus]|uniref:Uncharacterized protein n=1 Tax=Myxococcus fulvus TaxID=33 RepID=A0A511T6E2_MYXFU|nr:hypothetical protein MFU01_47660 [Myxococcus fulvus]
MSGRQEFLADRSQDREAAEESARWAFPLAQDLSPEVAVASVRPESPSARGPSPAEAEAFRPRRAEAAE